MSPEQLIGIAPILVVFWALYWYYSPMTMDEIQQAVDRANKKFHIKTFVSYTRFGPPRLPDRAVFLGWVILTHWPKGRILDIHSGPRFCLNRDPRKKPEEWVMVVSFWHTSYTAIGENDQLSPDMLVEV